MAENLSSQHCKLGRPILLKQEIDALITQIHKDWTLKKEDTIISRTFKLPDYITTIAFVNAIAWIAERQDHHPDLKVSYNCCRVNFTTYNVHGITLNDFICAALVDALVT